MANILIIDDQPDIRELISDILRDEGFTTSTAKNAAQALTCLETEQTPKAIILDIWLEGSHLDGIGLLKSIKTSHPAIPIIMISGHGTIETAVKTIRFGAYDFIEKPFKAEKLVILVKRAIESYTLAAQNNSLKQNNSLGADIIGNSKTTQALRNAAMLAAPTNSRIFITGEVGTGKEALAQMIHNHSKRNKHGFMVLQAASTLAAQLEEQLFGNQSLLEMCDGGTLFIDEISDMPLTVQTKLLHFLQQNSFQKLGSNTTIKVDVRIIAASSKNMDEELNAGHISQSLYYRLNVIPLHISPLRERKEDIKSIAEHTIQQLASTQGRKIHVTDSAYTTLCTYDWPGNVRQLLNTIEWLVIMSQNSSADIQPSDLPQAILDAVQGKHRNLNPISSEIISKQLKQARDLFEKEYLMAQLDRFDGNISKTATFIGMDRTALHRKIKSLKLQIDTDE